MDIEKEVKKIEFFANFAKRHRNSIEKLTNGNGPIPGNQLIPEIMKMMDHINKEDYVQGVNGYPEEIKNIDDLLGLTKYVHKNGKITKKYTPLGIEEINNYREILGQTPLPSTHYENTPQLRRTSDHTLDLKRYISSREF